MPKAKTVKRQIRELATRLEEMELDAALRPLAADFKRWEAGEIDAFDLKDLIHRFHQGPARKIYLRYDTPDPAAHVAYAIVQGTLDRAMISPEVLADLERWIYVVTEAQKADAD